MYSKKGLWKSVYIVDVPSSTVAITHMTPHTRYLGNYPTTTLRDGQHGGFGVNVTTHFWVPDGGANGTLRVSGSWGNSDSHSGSKDRRSRNNSDGDNNVNTVSSSGMMRLPPGESKFSLQLTATAAQIKLWWPQGLGGQYLYNVTATWTPSSPSLSPPSSPPVTTAVRKMGFRVFALVTINDTDTNTVIANTSTEGTGTHGMFFRVNGAAMYSRGANMVRCVFTG